MARLMNRKNPLPPFTLDVDLEYNCVAIASCFG